MGRRGTSVSLDEFVGGGEERSASPFDVGAQARNWEKRLSSLGKKPPSPLDLALPAFSLVRGGDLFERKTKPARTEASLVSAYVDENLIVDAKAAREEREAALGGILRVLGGNPAICRRMMLAKRIRLAIIPKGRDFREHGFPRHTNPNAAGIFWNSAKEEIALLGLREEYILAKPHLMIHEMTHAVHFLAFTQKEREEIDRMLMPVYRSRTWVEEAVAIYAERAFGASYTEEELDAPGLYGKTRRDWNPRHVFSRFMEELLRPLRPT
jgi:hypothetical protein